MGKCIEYNRDGTVTMTEDDRTLILTKAQAKDVDTQAARFFTPDDLVPEQTSKSDVLAKLAELTGFAVEDVQAAISG